VLGAIKAPKTIAFVEALPLSAVGKVLRPKCRTNTGQGASDALGEIRHLRKVQL
jgi:hypothetical protein